MEPLVTDTELRALASVVQRFARHAKTRTAQKKARRALRAVEKITKDHQSPYADDVD